MGETLRQQFPEIDNLAVCRHEENMALLRICSSEHFALADRLRTFSVSCAALVCGLAIPSRLESLARAPGPNQGSAGFRL